jgi:hypothetical protein
MFSFMRRSSTFATTFLPVIGTTSVAGAWLLLLFEFTGLFALAFASLDLETLTNMSPGTGMYLHAFIRRASFGGYTRVLRI